MQSYKKKIHSHNSTDKIGSDSDRIGSVSGKIGSASDRIEKPD
jgi:hypothetical protein